MVLEQLFCSFIFAHSSTHISTRPQRVLIVIVAYYYVIKINVFFVVFMYVGSHSTISILLILSGECKNSIRFVFRCCCNCALCIYGKCHFRSLLPWLETCWMPVLGFVQLDLYCGTPPVTGLLSDIFKT